MPADEEKMKSALGPFIAAIVLTLAGAGLWLAGRTETRLVDVHKQLDTLQYADAQRVGPPLEQAHAPALERSAPAPPWRTGSLSHSSAPSGCWARRPRPTHVTCARPRDIGAATMPPSRRS